MAKEHTTTVHVNIPDSILKQFDSVFPSCRTRFITNAMRIAANNKTVFDKIFFCNLFNVTDSNIQL